jgi:hypothetical protein
MATVKGTEEKAMQTIADELDMWSFYQPGDWPVAKTNADFIWFLLRACANRRVAYVSRGSQKAVKSL